MKQSLIFLFIFLFISAHAQKGKDYDNKKSTSMMPIVNGLYETINTLENENVEIVRIEFDQIVNKKTSIRKLDAGFTYGLMAYADYRVKQIVVRVSKKEKNEWKLLSSGETNGATAILHLEVKETADYLIEIEVKEFADGYTNAHYGLIIIHN
jgi:uncharacterized protein YaiE (UPF0345 family)